MALMALPALLALCALSPASTALFGSPATLKAQPVPRLPDGMKWFLTTDQLENGIKYVGQASRLRMVLDKLKRGEAVHLTAVGGSITAGLHGIPNDGGLPYSDYVYRYLEARFPKQVTYNNGGVPGTMSTYMSTCVNLHVPQNADLVLVEYDVNDPYKVEPLLNNEWRRSYERLVRKLMDHYPNRPAVVLVHAFNWAAQGRGIFWSNAERETGEIGLFYNLPSVSIRGCCYHPMVKGLPGFQVERARSSDPKKLAGLSHYWDKVHPDKLTGMKAMADLVIYLLQKVEAGLEARPFTQEEAEAVAKEPLPAPMIKGNDYSKRDKCFLGHALNASILETSGFAWRNDASAAAPKFGWISSQPGARIRMRVNTRSGLAGQSPEAAKAMVLVQILHLKSYSGMGRADVQCTKGCQCQPATLEGHHPSQRNSQLYLHGFYVSQADECELTISVSKSTGSGQWKVKVVGVVVNDELGQIKSAGDNKLRDAFDMVGEVTAGGTGEHGDGKTFDLRNRQPRDRQKFGMRREQLHQGTDTSAASAAA